MTEPCQCENPGWCERHQRVKSPHTHHLCQTREDYRVAWDKMIREHRPVRKRVNRPSLVRRVGNWARAISKWRKAGKPVRSNEEVAYIFERICRPCNDFDKDRGTCRICGCKLSKSKRAFANKVRMATETCPVGRWPGNEYTANDGEQTQ